METLFAFGTIWFWILIFIVCILAIVNTEIDEPNPLGWIIFIALPVILFFTGCKNEISTIINYIKDNPFLIIIGVFTYLIIGTFWSVAKWYFYLSDLREYFEEYRSAYSKRKVDVKENKEKILNWMVYWPLSAIWTLLNDPIKKMFKKIFGRIDNLFQGMSDNMMSKFEQNGKDKS
jgi:hypothetical protein